MKSQVDNYKHLWTYDERGILTCSVLIRGKWYRAKSEVLVLNDDNEVFLAFKGKDNKYKVPGGGWDKNDVDDVETVIRETLEEAHMKISDIHYKNSYTMRYESVNPKNPWIGAYVKVYVARYDGKKKYDTDKVDRDKTIEKKGQFYKIKKVYDRLSAVHQEALKDYI